MSNNQAPLTQAEMAFFNNLRAMVKVLPRIQVPAAIEASTESTGTVGELFPSDDPPASTPLRAPNLNPFGEAQGVSEAAMNARPSQAVMSSEQAVEVMTAMDNALNSGTIGTVRNIIHQVAPILGLIKGLILPV